jgi:hypothetical protein
MDKRNKGQEFLQVILSTKADYGTFEILGEYQSPPTPISLKDIGNLFPSRQKAPENNPGESKLSCLWNAYKMHLQSIQFASNQRYNILHQFHSFKFKTF